MNTPGLNEERYFSPAKTAERLDVSVDTLERHIRPALLSGEVASFKIGSRRLISWTSLLEYLKRNHNGALT